LNGLGEVDGEEMVKFDEADEDSGVFVEVEEVEVVFVVAVGDLM
jgi:hypothetical protein